MTRDQVKLLQLADNIYIEEIRKAALYNQIAQAFAVLLPVRAVGVMGDQRTYEQVSLEWFWTMRMDKNLNFDWSRSSLSVQCKRKIL